MRRAAFTIVGLLAAGVLALATAEAPTSLVVEVVDAQTGAALPARVEVRGPDGKPVKSEYELLPGVFTDESRPPHLPGAGRRLHLRLPDLGRLRVNERDALWEGFESRRAERPDRTSRV